MPIQICLLLRFDLGELLLNYNHRAQKSRKFGIDSWFHTSMLPKTATRWRGLTGTASLRPKFDMHDVDGRTLVLDTSGFNSWRGRFWGRSDDATTGAQNTQEHDEQTT